MSGDTIPAPACRGRLFAGLLTLGVVLFLCMLYLGSVVVRGLVFYRVVNLHESTGLSLVSRHEGQPYRVDAQLGFTLNPVADGVFLADGGVVRVAFHHDANGLRTDESEIDALRAGKRPRLLFLGDSYTYGMLVPARQTFPWEAARSLGGQALNAGVPGWGLAQMVLEAERSIPAYRPDYVIVQYSPWLPARSMETSAPGSQGLLMTPYFTDAGDAVRVVPPAFGVLSDTMERMAHYQTTTPDWRNKASFIFSLALPYFLRYDANMLLFKARLLFGLAPSPTQRVVYVIHDAYARIASLARENGAKMIILALGTDAPLVIPVRLLPKDVQLVNAQQAMLDALKEPTQANYAEHYFHWQQGRMVDKHPNGLADSIVADVLVKHIVSMGRQ